MFCHHYLRDNHGGVLLFLRGGDESLGGRQLLDEVVSVGHSQHHLEDAFFADLGGAQLRTSVEEGGDGHDGAHARLGGRT